MTLKNRRIALLILCLLPVFWLAGRALFADFNAVANYQPVMEKDVALATCRDTKTFDALYSGMGASQISRFWLVGKPDAQGQVTVYALEGADYASYPPLLDFKTPAAIWHSLNETELKRAFAVGSGKARVIAREPGFTVQLKLADVNGDGATDIVLNKSFDYDTPATETTVCAYRVEKGRAEFLQYGWADTDRSLLSRLLDFD